MNRRRLGQQLGIKHVAVGKDGRPLEGVGQLADIARPLACLESLADGLVQQQLRAPEIATDLGQQGPGERRDVLTPLPQRTSSNRKWKCLRGSGTQT